MHDGVSELMWADAVEQVAAIRSGRASSLELLDGYLERIDRDNGSLRAFVSLDVDGARDAARAADAAVRQRPAEELPPFLGVTVSIKDVVDVAGLPTTHSSKVLADNVAPSDSPVVARFRDAGFVIVGKTNVPEFCSSMTDSELQGTCRNPWDAARTPGGSSGGAAAALSAALCAVSHGTDGAGSVRSPASFCGLVGLKPTRGLVSFGPELGSATYGTTTDGVLTRSVRDAAALLDVLAAPKAARRLYADELGDEPGPLRIAVTTEAPFGTTTEECGVAALEAAELLAALGHTVERATPRWDLMLAVSMFPMDAPGPAALVRPDQVDDVEPRNRPMIEALAQLTVLDHTRQVQDVRAAAIVFLEFWDTFDVLVSPTAGIVAPSVDWAPWHQTPQAHMETFMGFPNFAQPFNLSGQPAISLPLTTSADGLPIGVHLAGRRNDEALLFRVARQLEQAKPWIGRRPAGYA